MLTAEYVCWFFIIPLYPYSICTNTPQCPRCVCTPNIILFNINVILPNGICSSCPPPKFCTYFLSPHPCTLHYTCRPLQTSSLPYLTVSDDRHYARSFSLYNVLNFPITLWLLGLVQIGLPLCSNTCISRYLEVRNGSQTNSTTNNEEIMGLSVSLFVCLFVCACVYVLMYAHTYVRLHYKKTRVKHRITHKKL
jgi:hypothetical protein